MDLKKIIKLILLIPLFLFAQKPYVKNYQKGLELFNKGDYDKAISWFEKSIKAKNDWDTVYVALGDCYMQKNDVKSALDNYNKAINLNKNNTTALLKLANYYQTFNNLNEALKYFEWAYQVDSTNLETLNQIASINYQLKNYPKSLSAYLKLAKKVKTDASVFYNLGNTYFMIEDYDNAIVAYNIAIKRNKRNADYYYALGMAYLRNADYPNAKRNFLIAVRLNPQKYGNIFDVVDYSGIKFEFLRTNFFGDELLSKISDGVRISFNANYLNYEKIKLEELTGIYLWKNDLKTLTYGLQLSFYYNPFSIDLSYSYMKYNISKISTYLPLPPYNPQSNLVDNIQYQSLKTSFNYIPWVFWGKLYNEYGVGFSNIKYTYDNKNLKYNTLYVKTSLNAKFNKFWLGSTYNMYFNKNVPSNLEFNIGVWLW